MRENRAKQKLNNGEVVTILTGHGDTEMIDFLGPLDLDGVWLEGEHGPLSWQQIGDGSRACDLWGMTPLTRVNQNDAGLIMRTLDCGSMGVVGAPRKQSDSSRAGCAGRQVCSDRDAGHVWGPPIVRGSRLLSASQPPDHGGDPDRGARSNRQAGRDTDRRSYRCLFVAPSDLAQTMGHIGNPTHPEVQAAIDGALAQIIAAGKNAGTVVFDETVERYVAAGVSFLLTSWDIWVAQGAGAFLERVRSAAR